jgi:hypothetical protein
MKNVGFADVSFCSELSMSASQSWAFPVPTLTCSKLCVIHMYYVQKCKSISLIMYLGFLYGTILCI